LLEKAFLDAKNRGVKLLYVTEINRDNLSYCKQLLTMVDELRVSICQGKSNGNSR
jgi:two-component system, OmpR family, sensor histidine kinase VicK